MDGVHDLGGMHGFGAPAREHDEPVFHHDWERRVFAMTMASGFVTLQGDDHFRRHVERVPPARYLRSSYYELWLEGLIGQLKEAGVISQEELEAGKALEPLPKQLDTAGQARAEGVLEAVLGGASQAAPEATGYPHRFKVGERVRTRANMAYGHNRLPRYARAREGTVIAENGAFVFADTHSQSGEPNPQMLYTVEFEARTLWGEEGRRGDTLCLDLWDAYLEPLDP